MNKTTYVAGVCLLGSMLTGCGGSNEFKPVSGMDGMDIYANACSSCHGENGGGKFGILLKLAGSEDTTDQIVGKIRNGGHIMPAFPNIDTQQAKLVADYLKSL